VTETAVVVSGGSVVAWYGQVVSLPSDAQFDDYLALEPKDTGELGLTGADPALAITDAEMKLLNAEPSKIKDM